MSLSVIRYIGKLLGVDASRDLYAAGDLFKFGKLTIEAVPSGTGDYEFDAVVATGTSIAVNDYVYFDTAGSSPYKVRPAADEPWLGDLGATQTAFRRHFAGIAMSAGSGGDTITIDANPFTRRTVATASEVHEVGKTLGLDKGAGNFLSSTTLENAGAHSAIFRCWERASPASTSVVGHITPQLHHAFHRFGIQ